jgi:hypothetical protein
MYKRRGGFCLTGRHGLLVILTLFLTTACTSLPIVIPAAEDSFLGIDALLEDANGPRPLHVFIIHGMGTEAPNQFDGFILGLANRLRLVQIPPNAAAPVEPQPPECPPQSPPSPSGLIDPVPTFIDIDGLPSYAQARLYTYDFSSSSGDSTPPILEVSFLYWAPLTEGVKCAALAEQGAPQRQWFAELARGFVDDKLGDVVLYAGKYRDQIMRPSVQAALCDLIHGTPSRDGKTCENGDPTERTVLISHSLGGYMLMDAIDEELHRGQKNGAPNRGSAAYKIVQNTQLIYMMANQLALLDLTTLDQYPNHFGPNARQSGYAIGASREMAQRFERDWVQIRPRFAPLHLSERGGTTEINRQIVAFSDPNDILSWLVKPNNLELPAEEWSKVKLTNVFMSNNEFSIPGVFSDPVTAHTGYFDNRTVLEFLVCGMANGSVVDSCLENGAK